MKQNTRFSTPLFSCQRGFTLLEMLLAVGVIGLVMIGVAAITSDMVKQRAAQTAGQQISRIAELSEDTMLRVSDAWMFPSSGSLSTASASDGGFSGTALSVLEGNSYPINSSTFRIAGSPVDVVYGLIGAAASGGLGMARIFVVLKKPIPLSQAAKIARSIGGRGGLIRSDNPNMITSAFGSWRYPIAGQVGPLEPYGNPPAGEAYVVAYSAFTASDKRGPYLSKFGGSEGENVMHTDILMNGNSIIGVKDIDVGTLSATRAAKFDQLAVDGKANFQGSVDMNNTVNVKGDLSVSDGDMSVSNGNLVVPGGNISAKGLRADTLEAEDLTTKDVFTETLNVEGGDTLITSNVTISGGASLDITGPLKATIVDAANITTDNMKATNLAVKDSTTLGGNTTINGTTNIDQLILDGCMKLDGKDYGTCPP